MAAVCHGSASDEQARALNALLRSNSDARDEYILRLELHSRLASDPELHPWAEPDPGPARSSHTDYGGAYANPIPALSPNRGGNRRQAWILGLAAALVLVAAGGWGLWHLVTGEKTGTTSNAVAMLNRVVDARWMAGAIRPRLGAPLEPGWLRLESGLAQIVFYSGARIVIQGPADLELVSQNQASCRSGRLTAEVPSQARGFRVGTPHMSLTDLGTSFGLDVAKRRTELHVFKGSVELQPNASKSTHDLREGVGAVIEESRPPRLIEASPSAFTSLFDLQSKSLAAESIRYDQWRASSEQIDRDPSLLVHLDFENGASPDWRLPNAGSGSAAVPDATIVGCQWSHGRWPEKRALEFQSVSDRVRLSVPGEFDALTLATWVRVQGLDRQFNSLFMCDGFEPGEVHWLIRNDGVLSFTVKGSGPGNFQIIASPPVLTLDRIGLWVHLAVVLDGRARRAIHYVNGLRVGDKPLKLAPPYHIGAAELGNWNSSGFPGNHPSLIRNFSGVMDEFFLFTRALKSDEILALYSQGKPQADTSFSTAETTRNQSIP